MGRVPRSGFLGAGAGSFETYWNEHRPFALKVRDAHSLYAEVLGELGPIGLVLLLAALLTPLVAAVRARRHPLVPFAAAAYVALPRPHRRRLGLGDARRDARGYRVRGALLLAARSRAPRPLSTPRLARRCSSAVLAAGVFAFIGLIGNSAYERGETAEEADNLVLAEREARKAARWAPWSAEPWLLLVDVLEDSDPAEARRSAREAIEREPYDFRAWYELAKLTSGAEQRRALAEAQRLNPRSPLVAGLATEIQGAASGG